MRIFGHLSLKYLLPFLLGGVVFAGSALENSEKRPLAYVQKFKPQVGVQKGDQLQNIKKRGKPLFNGDTLRTNKNGFALVQFMDKSLAKVKPESRLIVKGQVESKQNTSTRIGLETGEILLNVTTQGSGNFEVATNTTVASVKGTEFGASSDDYFWVEEGEVELLVTDSGESVTLTDQTYGQVQDDGSIDTGELTDEEVDEKSKEYDQMDSKLEPEIYKLRFIDSNGQVRVIEVKVFENDS